jgi:hypothetical protein
MQNEIAIELPFLSFRAESRNLWTLRYNDKKCLDFAGHDSSV